MIISVSRRCDIPRFRFDWFLERLKLGFVDTVNPFNAKQVKRVSLLPGDTDAFVFWTRDPRPILDHLPELENRGFYTMVTLTAYPALLEPGRPPVDEVINAMPALAKSLGPSRIIWRYDPVFLSSITPPEFHVRNFTALARALGGTVDRVIISVYDEYAGAERRIHSLEGRDFRMFPQYGETGALLPGLRDLLAELAAAARNCGITMQSCAEAENLAEQGIQAGACIDRELIGRIRPAADSPADIPGKDKNQRPHCRCAPSVDIGSYGLCPAGCIYCYANRRR
jgi:hypothetical protein